MDNESIRNLERASADGDGEAAFELYTYYSLAGRDAKKSDRYFERAVELEYPASLYKKALLIWAREESPNIDQVARLLSRALELGFDDNQNLKEEVDRALETGVVPQRSNLRLFPDLSRRKEVQDSKVKYGPE